MDQAIKDILKRLDGASVQAMEYETEHGSGSAILAPDGWKVLEKLPPVTPPQFSAVTVTNCDSLIAYTLKYGGPGSAVFSGDVRIIGVIDYHKGDGTLADRRKHSVSLACGYSADTKKPMEAIEGVLGKWITLDQFEMLIHSSGLVIESSTALLEIISDLEGTEVVKISRTRQGQSATVSGGVKSSIDMPKNVSVRGVFMGIAIKASIPFRVTIEANKIKFQLIDDGSLEFSKITARNMVTEQVRGALEEKQIQVYSGQL
jgi:hypothetical protein